MTIFSKEGEEQELMVKVIFKTKHSPDNEEHLRQVLRSTLKDKGILEDAYIKFDL